MYIEEYRIDNQQLLCINIGKSIKEIYPAAMSHMFHSIQAQGRELIIVTIQYIKLAIANSCTKQ